MAEEQLAPSNLRRATCAEQLAQSNLRRATCAEQLAQSNLRTATCADQLAQTSLRRATCTHCNSHRATCAKLLAQSNLRMCQAGVKQVCRTSWGVMLSGHSSCRSLTQGVLIMKEVAGSMADTAYLRAWRTRLLLCGILRMRFGSNRSHGARSS